MPEQGSGSPQQVREEHQEEARSHIVTIILCQIKEMTELAQTFIHQDDLSRIGGDSGSPFEGD